MTKFFAAANTEKGFVSLFDDIFSPEHFRRIYILKGGPGCGKSTMMKKIGAAAEAGGWETEYLYCSSDPASLDGVTIPALSTAILDGTAPHTVDPKYPGAVERIVNLSEAFDCRSLEKKQKQIRTLIRQKGEYYRTAYRFLASAGILTKECDMKTAAFFMEEKAKKTAFRIAESLRNKKKGEEKWRYLSAISIDGPIRLDSFGNMAKTTYAVTEKYGLGYAFMDVLYREFTSRGLAMIVCRTPLTQNRMEAIFLEGDGILFLLSDESGTRKADKVINTGRFLREDILRLHRPSFRFTEKCSAILLDGAYEALKKAGDCHRETESIYGKAISFQHVDREYEKILSEIFENNM